ncbi:MULTISPECIES: threonine ammonia-lyase [Tepidanaerobacter]|uniref:L-threonine dehydratase catabolic TdcB n=2 Tax=Tepidanaerobacter syntrophicus TaxID=224999 RepID=A0A0U9HEL6_9FIRM|nr:MULTISPECIES: threonine ammonia-lyase [Tepidanaerobacter]GAQ25257.1 threonine dehydratase [Tepidanaerobacter syntrophicus]GLI18747.1 threonine dehydratase [Tepidanaerobacter syntrophicus]GLI50823.1 threonine dehydratase [Tepidanaerobacter syntrophicus]
MENIIGLDDIEEARKTLNNVAYNTGLVHNTTFSEMTGNSIYLKMENLQKTGSFKIRGAFNKIAHLPKKYKKKGVIAASAGNHAQGVAMAAKAYGIKATIVMPKHAPLSKIAATRGYGAEVILHGHLYDEAYEKAREIQEETGAVFIHPFDDPEVIAGQGTIGIEILEDLPDTDIIIVPVGGGGLISGIAVATKSIKPDIKIIGVQSKNMPSMAESIFKDRITTVDGMPTIADGIAVKTPGKITFEIVKRYVDNIVTVDEDEIANAILLLMERAKVIAEGAGAASVAALLNRMGQLKDKKIVALLSGGNIDVNMLSRIIDSGLVKSGRKVFINTLIPDRPGTLGILLNRLADTGANVLSVTHNRSSRDIPIGYAKVELELETTSEEHIEEIKELLSLDNYSFVIL